MLKSCWDCLINANRQAQDDGDSYAVHLNGDTQRAPPWPSQQEHTIMFVLPRQLKSGDRIIITGQISSNPGRFSLNLVTGANYPDNQNIACQLEARFPPSGDNKLVLRVVQNGYAEEISGDYQEMASTDWFTDSSFQFVFKFTIDYGESNVELMIGESYLADVALKHNISDVRFLTLDGDVAKVDKLEFLYA